MARFIPPARAPYVPMAGGFTIAVHSLEAAQRIAEQLTTKRRVSLR